MGLDNIIVSVMRLLIAITTGLIAIFIAISERLMAAAGQKTAKAANLGAVGAAAGVPAAAAVQPAPAPTPLTAPATPAPIRPPTVVPVPLPAPAIEGEHEPNELDWAGSLSHAAVASLHLGNVLDLVRAGWLIPDDAHVADVGAALDAMEAFQDRTATAVAPLLDTMTDDQRAEFFADFGDDFPRDLPDLDTQGHT